MGIPSTDGTVLDTASVAENRHREFLTKFDELETTCGSNLAKIRKRVEQEVVVGPEADDYTTELYDKIGTVVSVVAYTTTTGVLVGVKLLDTDFTVEDKKLKDATSGDHSSESWIVTYRV